MEKKFVPKILTLPKGTTLCHERSTLFPEGKLHPFFAYNWYSTTPFWSCTDDILGKPKNDEPVARYIYTVKEDVPNFLEWTDEDALQHLFKQMWSGYVLEEDETSNDYALAAFATQVLGYSGLLNFGNPESLEETLIMGGEGSRYLKFEKLLTFNHPQPHPGYAESTVVEHGYKGHITDFEGITFYTPEEVKKIRATIAGETSP